MKNYEILIEKCQFKNYVIKIIKTPFAESVEAQQLKKRRGTRRIGLIETQIDTDE